MMTDKAQHDKLIARLDAQTRELERKLSGIDQGDEVVDRIKGRLAVVRDCLRRVNRIHMENRPFESGDGMELLAYEVRIMSSRCQELREEVEGAAPRFVGPVDTSVMN